MWRCYDIGEHQRGLRFVGGKLVEVLAEGQHWRFDWQGRSAIEVVSTSAVWLECVDLAAIAESRARPSDLLILDLAADERARVWIDGRLERQLGPGRYALWTSSRAVVVEVVEIETKRLA